MKRVYLLSGGPGTGKTTIIKEVLRKFQGRAGGFYTEEIRGNGAREGFRIITLDGKSAILAHIDIKSPYHVGRYGVDIEALDRIGVSAIREAVKSSELVIIDEIGRMELFSPSFKEAVLEAIGSGKRVLGTIMLKSHPFSDEVKISPGVALISVARSNRNEVLGEVLGWLEEAKDGENRH